jgi:predicted GNAT family N-acyltransferase
LERNFEVEYNGVAMKTIYKLDTRHMIQLHKLFQKEWWTKKRSLEETQKVVENSSIVIGLVDNDNDLKAFSRVLTDYTFKAVIFDVIVEERLRNKGIGKELIRLILEHEDLKEVKHFELYCLPEMIEFYKSYGFSDELGELVFMRLDKSEQL